MTKKNFLFLMLTVMAGLLFALGMCMCLLPEWNAFSTGVVLTALGAVALLVIAVVRWHMSGKPVPTVDWKKTGKIAWCVLAALVLGTGMAMILCFQGMMIPGIVVGMIGILLGVCAIPVCRGLK